MRPFHFGSISSFQVFGSVILRDEPGIVHERDTGCAQRHPSGLLVEEARAIILRQGGRGQAGIEPALLREIFEAARIRAMDEIGADAPGLTLGDEALHGLDRAGPHELDLEIGEMLVHCRNQPGHGAGGERHVDAHRPGTIVDGGRILCEGRRRGHRSQERKPRAGARQPTQG